VCGIAGLIDPQRLPATELEDRAGRMADRLAHRGPDDRGTWADPAAGVAFGFRRLSVQDLSPAGHQPMMSASGRYVLVFNGEMYNFKRLRADLEPLGHCFRGGSDTEVMLAAFEQWGIEGSLKRFIGMFAFAVWDSRDRVLTLARDPLGIKPLYWGLAAGTLLFGSELKALRAHPAFDRPVDRGALALLLRYSYLESPHTIYAGMRKLPAGCWLALHADGGWEAATPRPYWSARDAVERPGAAPGSPGEAIEQLEALLQDVIRLQMVADVPVGAFLSGGVDSSLVVALMQGVSSRPIRTFTIGFEDAACDEAAHARAVARHLNTEHTELVVTPAEALAVIPRLPEMYDEPLADSSQIPTFLVSKLARNGVTVALSGDGGDELFGGYNKYAWAERLWRRSRFLPGAFRRTVAMAVTAVPPATWDATMRTVSPVLPRRLAYGSVGLRLHKVARVISGGDPAAMYRRLVSAWERPDEAAPGVDEPLVALTEPARSPAGLGFTEWMMWVDLVSYLPDDVLAKLDRASMSVSLESRVPLLDHRVAEYAWRLPLAWKIRDGAGKWPLRQLLYRRVPRELVDRPKQGFAMPLGPWLRGPLRDWAESLIAQDRLAREGYFAPGVVRARWAAHLAGQRDASPELWPVLMFQAWLDDARPPRS
jgi:asparagine synthase (glutamine-hydrolysing)